MEELYGPSQFHSQNREYFGVFGPVDFGQTVDGTAVSELEKSAFRDMESDSCETAAPRSLGLCLPVCARGRLFSARRLKSARCGFARLAGIRKNTLRAGKNRLADRSNRTFTTSILGKIALLPLTGHLRCFPRSPTARDRGHSQLGLGAPSRPGPPAVLCIHSGSCQPLSQAVQSDSISTVPCVPV